MNDLAENSLIKLKERITELVILYERLNEDNRELKNEVERLIKENQEKEKTISELKEKNENLSIATTLVSNRDEGENKLAKERINNLVRDIDKCIALLNR